MTDAISSGSDAGSLASHLHDTRRVDHVIYGHLGRLSYSPAEDDESWIGELTSGRATARAPHFQQISPFQRWVAPTKALSLSKPTGKASQSIRSQERWLLKSHPEAFLGNEELRESLAKEIPRLKSSNGDASSLSILAVGEIHDKSSSWKSQACPALAIAAGEAGHILRISTLQSERWSWAADNSHEINLATLSNGDQGFWCADGAPITKIQFAIVRKQYDQIRWLIVQKATTTTIFQPEIRKHPVGDTGLPCYLDPEKTSHIAVNPILTFTQEDTGGNAHRDFSFNTGSGNFPPQIAIVDETGRWMVWDITRERVMRRTALRPFKRSSGRLLDIQSGKAPSQPHNNLEKLHRVFWVTRGDSQSSIWDDASSPSEDSVASERDHIQQLPGLDIPSPRCDTLLLCGSQSVQLFNARSGNSIACIDLSKHGATDHVLDVQVSSHNRSNAFVLTKSILYWLDIFPQTSSGSAHATIQLSCPHHRNGDCNDLKLSVVSDRPSGRNDVSLVIIFSSRTLHVDLFWFVQPNSRPTFHHQSVRISDLANGAIDNLIGLESITIIPAPLSKRGKKSGHESFEGKSVRDSKRYLQLLGVGADLSLNYCLAATSVDIQYQSVAPDSRVDSLRPNQKRKRFLRETGESFVVPDFVEGEASAQGPPLPSITLNPSGQHVRHSRHFQLWHFVGRLFHDVTRRLPSKDTKIDPDGTVAMGEMEAFLDGALARNEADGFISLRPVLDLLTNPQQHFDLGNAEPQWTSAFKKLRQTGNKRVKLLQVGLYQAKLNITDLFEALSILWSARLPGDHLRPALWRRIEFALERIATEVYLSGRSIRLVPEKLLETEQTTGINDETANEDNTQASRSLIESALPTPSTSPSSAQSSVSGKVGSEEGHEEDLTILRLRTYAASIKSPLRLKSGESRLLSHWPKDAGHNPDEYVYMPEESRRRDAERVKTWRRQQEDRRRRRAASQALLKQEESGDSSSQPIPRQAYSSQPQPASSQSQGPIIMSQPIPGQHGTRSALGKKKTKAKKPRRITGGFR